MRGGGGGCDVETRTVRFGDLLGVAFSFVEECEDDIFHAK